MCTETVPVPDGDKIAERAILSLVISHRAEQERRYRAANDTMPFGTGPGTRWLLPYTTRSAEQIEDDLRTEYEDYSDENGGVTWAHVLREEFAEVMEADDLYHLETELIQLAAVAIGFAQRVRRTRTGGRA